MTNKERDEILISLVKAVNNLQVTVNEIRNEMKNMVTKEEAKKFATKEDLKGFATKEDLKGFATKEDLKKFATKEDLKKFATKEDLKNFVTKDYLEQSLKVQKEEICKEVSGVMNVIKETIYEQQMKLEIRVASNENEIKKLKLAIAN